jgi:hypothetical protein
MTTTIKTLIALTIATAALAASILPGSASFSGPAGIHHGDGQRLPVAPPRLKLPPYIGKGPVKCIACSPVRPHPAGPIPVNAGQNQVPVGALGETCQYVIECISKTDPPTSEACNNGYAAVVKVCTPTPRR